MKALVFTMSHLLAAASTLAQGTVYLANYVQGFPGSPPLVDAAFFEDHGNRLAGTNYLAQLYASRTQDFLVAVDTQVPFVTHGYINATNGPFHAAVVTIPARIVGLGGPAWVQVRAWEAVGGASFEEAAMAGRSTG